MQKKSHIVRTLETPSQFQGLHIALALSTSRKDKDILSKAIRATNPDPPYNTQSRPTYQGRLRSDSGSVG